MGQFLFNDSLAGLELMKFAIRAEVKTNCEELLELDRTTIVEFPTIKAHPKAVATTWSDTLHHSLASSSSHL